MALLSSGLIELVDLTDTRAAMLYLSTSLPKVQVQINESFSPDFSTNQGTLPEYNNGMPTGNNRENTDEVGLHIIPNLYFGQEIISINNFYDKITYQIENKIYKYNVMIDENVEPIYVNRYGELVYKKNLEKDSIFIIAEIEEYNDNINYYEDIQGQIELVKVESYNFLPMINYNKNIFSFFDNDDIQLTAILYKDGQEYSGNIEYEWTISPKIKEEEVIGTEKNLQVSRDWISNLATVFCSMTPEGSSTSYTTQVTITDKTDPLSSHIISSKGLIFSDTDQTNKILLTCEIYRGTTLLNDESESDETSYEWYYYTKETEDFKMLEGENFTKKQISVFPLDYVKADSITYQCQATYRRKGTAVQEKTTAQIGIIISKDVREIITPQQIFIHALESGGLPSNKNGSFVETIRFQLVDTDGKILPRSDNTYLDGDGIEAILSNNIASPFEFAIRNGSDDETLFDYNIDVTFNEQIAEDGTKIFGFSDLKNSTSFRAEYYYRGFPLEIQFYLVKNFSGRAIETVLEYYILSESDIKFPEQFEYDENGNIIKDIWDTAPVTPTLEKPYLWNYEVTIYSSEPFITRTEPVVIAMYGEEGRGIKSITNYYCASNDTNPENLPEKDNLELWKLNSADAGFDSNKPYLWNFEMITFDRGTKDNPSDISKYTEPNIIGTYGRSISVVKEFYALSSSGDEPPDIGTDKGNPNEDYWSQNISSPTVDSPFLWNYEYTKYNDGSTPLVTDPIVIAIYTEDGRSILKVENYYYANSLTNPEELPRVTDLLNILPSNEWKTDPIQANFGKDNIYLWNFEVIIFDRADSDGSVATRTDPCIIGSYGRDGTSVNPKGTYDSLEELKQNHPTAQEGDAYTVKGEMYVWVDAEKGWVSLGPFQGTSSYLHIAYADSITFDSEGNVDGYKGFTNENTADVSNKAYLGKYIDGNTIDSDNPQDYKWTRIQGSGVESVTVFYYTTTSKTEGPAKPEDLNPPTGWLVDAPEWESGRYLWITYRTIYTNGTYSYSSPYCDGSWASVSEESIFIGTEKEMIDHFKLEDENPIYPPANKLWLNTDKTPDALMKYIIDTSTGEGTWEEVIDAEAIKRGQDEYKTQLENVAAEYNNLKTAITFDDSTGLHLYKGSDNYNKNEVLITSDDVQIKVSGNSYSTFLAGALELGNMRIYAPESGGLAFAPKFKN